MRETSILLLLFLLLLPLSACKETTYSLLLEVEGHGEILFSGDLNDYEQNTVVLLEAVPYEGWRFLYWRGPVQKKKDRVTSLLIQNHQVVTAIFVREEEIELLPSLSLGPYNPLLLIELFYKDQNLRPGKIRSDFDPVQRGLEVWLNSVRPFKSPYLYWLFRETVYGEDLPERWVHIKDFDRESFGEVLMEYPFRMDFGSGVLDFSPEEKDFFFLKREHNRDCDNWARMWFWWAEHHQYPVWEIAIIDGYDLRTAHMITVFKDERGYHLCNYEIVGVYSSLEEAVMEFSHQALTSSGVYENLRWAIYQSSTP